MPARDGSGPMGAGPATGRGFGPCTGAGLLRRGAGAGLGFANRFGAGRGFCRWFGFGNATSKTQKELLQGQKEFLKDQIKAIDDEIEGL